MHQDLPASSSVEETPSLLNVEGWLTRGLCFYYITSQLLHSPFQNMEIKLSYHGTMVQVTPVTFEHYETALGIGQSTPRISWKILGDEKNWTQSSYELKISVISTHPESEKPQEFKIKSSDSVLVPWPCAPLKSRESAVVQVRVTGLEGTESSQWSAPSTVEIGLLEKQDWKSQVIAAPRTISARDSLRPALFRKEFELTKKVQSARFYITAYGVYEAFINGKKIGDHVLNEQILNYLDHDDCGHKILTNLMTLPYLPGLENGVYQQGISPRDNNNDQVGRLDYPIYLENLKNPDIGCVLMPEYAHPSIIKDLEERIAKKDFTLVYRGRDYIFAKIVNR